MSSGRRSRNEPTATPDVPPPRNRKPSTLLQAERTQQQKKQDRARIAQEKKEERARLTQEKKDKIARLTQEKEDNRVRLIQEQEDHKEAERLKELGRRDDTRALGGRPPQGQEDKDSEDSLSPEQQAELLKAAREKRRQELRDIQGRTQRLSPNILEQGSHAFAAAGLTGSGVGGNWQVVRGNRTVE